MIDSNRPILLIEHSNEDYEVTVSAIRVAHVLNPFVRCKNGPEAMDYIHRRGKFMHGVEPLFVLVDLNIPGIDGRRILAELRKSLWLSAVPAIILSRSTNPRDIRLCYQLGAAGYLAKPVNLERFELMIQRLTEYWMEIVMLPEQEELGYGA